LRANHFERFGQSKVNCEEKIILVSCEEVGGEKDLRATWWEVKREGDAIWCAIVPKQNKYRGAGSLTLANVARTLLIITAIRQPPVTTISTLARKCNINCDDCANASRMKCWTLDER
jgi:hypothetical protein